MRGTRWAVVAILAAGCSHGGSTAQPGPQPLGTPLAFKTGAGVALTVTVQKIEPAAKSVLGVPPPAGDQYLGIVVSLSNQSATNGAMALAPISSLVDISGQSLTPTYVDLVGCPGALQSGVVQVAPGATTTTCLSFEVPTGDKPTELVIGSSGKTPGIWTLS